MCLCSLEQHPHFALVLNVEQSLDGDGGLVCTCMVRNFNVKRPHTTTSRLVTLESGNVSMCCVPTDVARQAQNNGRQSRDCVRACAWSIHSYSPRNDARRTPGTIYYTCFDYRNAFTHGNERINWYNTSLRTTFLRYKMPFVITLFTEQDTENVLSFQYHSHRVQL